MATTTYVREGKMIHTLEDGVVTCTQTFASINKAKAYNRLTLSCEARKINDRVLKHDPKKTVGNLTDWSPAS